jgi:hypothetical protein
MVVPNVVMELDATTVTLDWSLLLMENVSTAAQKNISKLTENVSNV